MTDYGLLEHYKTDGIYIRVIDLKKDMTAIGRKHLTNHLNILLEGAIEITIAGETRTFTAPYIFEAKAGSVKMVQTLTDCKFANIIPTDLEFVDDVVDEITVEPVDTDMKKLLGGTKL